MATAGTLNTQIEKNLPIKEDRQASMQYNHSQFTSLQTPQTTFRPGKDSQQHAQDCICQV
jgi:hypothetical protein